MTKCNCEPKIMFWYWKDTPVLHAEYHQLLVLHEKAYKILEHARARVKLWTQEAPND